MADVFYTILIIWILWRIFGRSTIKTHVIHHHQYSQSNHKEGEVRITQDKKSDTKKKNDDEGDYVDFEEVK